MAYNNGYGKIIGCIIGVIVAICVIFVAAIGIKALATDTSFVESWNDVWGIETVQEETPDNTEDEDKTETPADDEQTPSDVTEEDGTENETEQLNN